MRQSAARRVASEEGAVPFGRFVLLRRLASGGMAEVYVARSVSGPALPRLVAIKRMLPHVGTTGDFVDMFVNEAKLVCRLDHPNIVRSFEYGQHGGDYYIAMELVRGLDLRQLGLRLARRRGWVPPVVIAAIAEKVCSALAYAHDLRGDDGERVGLIHRDVTPHNILVGFDGAVKIIDFGIAKTAIQSSNTNVGTLKGKVCYMSPEQASCGDLDHRSDLFSAGTCFWEMATGERLFNADGHYLETLEQVRMAKIPAPSELRPEVPRALDEIVMRALARDPADRFQSAAEMAQALHRFVSKQSGGSSFSLAGWMRSAFRAEHRRLRLRLAALARLPVEAPREPAGREATLTFAMRDTVPDIPRHPILTRSGVRSGTRSGTMEGPTQVFFSIEVELPEWNEPGALDLVGEEPHGLEPAALGEDGVAPPEDSPGGPAVPRPVVPISAFPARPTSNARRRDPRTLTFVGAVAALACLVAAAATFLAISLPTDPSGMLRVHLATATPGATVMVDGERLGPAPLSLEGLPAGTHEVLVQAAGYVDLRQRVDVEDGATTIVAANLLPAPRRAAMARAPAAEAEAAGPPPSDEAPAAEWASNAQAAATPPASSESGAPNPEEAIAARAAAWARTLRLRRLARARAAQSAPTAHDEAPETAGARGAALAELGAGLLADLSAPGRRGSVADPAENPPTRGDAPTPLPADPPVTPAPPEGPAEQTVAAVSPSS